MSRYDRVRFFLAKLLGKRTILFSPKPSWDAGIKKHIASRYVPFFYAFDEVCPDRFDTVVPLGISEQQYLNAHPELSIHRQRIIPSDAVIDLCNDKLRFNRFMQAHGLGAYIPRIGTELPYPYLIKKRIGSWGLDIAIIRNAEDEANCERERQSDEYFMQEYVEGVKEYSANILIRSGVIELYRTLEFTFHDDYFIKGKHGKFKKVRPIDHTRFLGDFERVLTAVGYQGLCAINYKVCEEGIKIFEINPRYGAYTHRYINEVLACHFAPADISTANCT